MNGKSLAFLALALLFGLGAMIGTSKMLAKNKRSVATEMQDVLVATRDLKVEELLTPELVKVIPMARQSVPAGTFTSYKDVEDRWLMIKTLEGEPILDRKLAPKGSPAGLVSRIHPGMRAFTLEVNEQTGVSGFILPDHRVDVVQSEQNNNNGPPKAETILEDVPVLASGQVFTRQEDRSIQVRSVTLEVTPEQVDILAAARTKGPLSLALRGINERTKVKPKPKPVEVVEKKPEPAPPPPPPPVVEQKPEPTPEPIVEPVNERHYVYIYRGLNHQERVPLHTNEGEESDMAFPPIDQ